MLPETGFLAEASTDLRRLLADLSAPVTLDSGGVLFSEGDTGDALYAILDGALEISIIWDDGRKLGLDIMRAGSLFGEIALFDPGPRTATATALTACRLARVRNADLLREIDRRPALAADMILLAGRRMRWMSQQLHEQVFLPLPTRLARKVLYLTPPGLADRQMLDLSQAELAEFVGATREAVSKTLGAWKQRGLVDSVRGGLVIRDRDALREIGNLC